MHWLMRDGTGGLLGIRAHLRERYTRELVVLKRLGAARGHVSVWVETNREARLVDRSVLKVKDPRGRKSKSCSAHR